MSAQDREQQGDEARPRPDEERRAFAEEADSLWRITLGPAIWAVHFAVTYGAVAAVCAKLGAEGLGAAQWVLGALTLVALAIIAWLGWSSFHQWDVMDTGEFSNPEGRAEDRHQFLGHAAFLLAVLSFVGVIYTALPLMWFASCR